MDTQLGRIATTIAAVASRDDLSETFGAQGHRFRLAAPVPLSEVAAFEQRYGIRLPRGYRRFITELGGSGAGPSYGLRSPWQAIDMVDPLVNLRAPSHFDLSWVYTGQWWPSRKLMKSCEARYPLSRKAVLPKQCWWCPARPRAGSST